MCVQKTFIDTLCITKKRQTDKRGERNRIDFLRNISGLLGKTHRIQTTWSHCGVVEQWTATIANEIRSVARIEITVVSRTHTRSPSGLNSMLRNLYSDSFSNL